MSNFGGFGDSPNGRGRKPLFSGDRDYENDDIESLGVDQRTRLLAGNERLNDHTDRLTRINKIGAETEEIGVEITNALARDTEILISNREKVRAIDSKMDDSKRVLWGIWKGNITTKLLLILMILVMIIGICLVVFVKWYQSCLG
eukprot:TRINITY_DN11674_c0_g1_i2.p1 TRINITY_DN11674_c0_g1~~TRINITY_DN11674_c0_g1_i2.p1  ORF type:complete len:145 (-),score=12.12 TRINITY_DN11674_c0_g1_i2:134-568(-)